MARPEIGGITMLSLGPSTVQQAPRMRRYERPGLDGTAYTLFGKKAPVTALRGKIDCEDADDVVSKRAAFYALQGTASTVQDIAGNSRNVIVERVRELSLQPIKTSVGGTNNDSEYMLWMEFMVTETDLS